MKSRLIASLSTGILGLSLAATTALAHHGWAGQSTEPFTLKGKVETPLSLSGPHATMKIKDDKVRFGISRSRRRRARNARGSRKA